MSERTRYQPEFEDPYLFEVLSGTEDGPMVLGAFASAALGRAIDDNDEETANSVEGVRQAFVEMDLDSLPDGVRYPGILALNPLLWLHTLYEQSDIKSLRVFTEFMATRHQRLQYALRRDLPEFVDLLDDSLSGTGDDLRPAATGAYERLGVRAIGSFESGWSAYVGFCRRNEDSALEIGLSNEYADRKLNTGIGPDLERTVVHEGVHAAHADLGAGFSFGIDNTNTPTGLLEEIGTEIRTRMAISGARDVDDVLGVRGSYSSELELYMALSTRAGINIPIELLFEAQTSSLDDTSSHSARRRLGRDLDENAAELLPEYPGEHAFVRLCNDYRNLSARARRRLIIGQLATLRSESYIFEDEAPIDMPVVSFVEYEPTDIL